MTVKVTGLRETQAALKRTAVEIHGIPKPMLLAAVKAVKKISDQEVARDVGGDLAMSNFGRGRTKIRLKDDFKSGSGQASVTLKPWPSSAAPWSWLESGTSAHKVGRRRKRNSTGRLQRRRMVIGGNVRSGPWVVRGMAPKRTFSRIEARADREVKRIGLEEVKRVLRKNGWGK